MLKDDKVDAYFAVATQGEANCGITQTLDYRPTFVPL